MANVQKGHENVINYNKRRTTAEARENGRKGGIASGIARRSRKRAEETFIAMLKMQPAISPQLRNTLTRMGVRKNARPDILMLCAVAFAQKMLKADVPATKLALELAGETPDASILQAKAAEYLMRAGAYDDTGATETETSTELITRRMASMSDAELEQYEVVCSYFEDEDETDEGESEADDEGEGDE